MTRLALVSLLLCATARADAIDDEIRLEMGRRQIPGLSLAVGGGKIVKAQGYGVTAAGGAPVTPATLFQAGSISKSVPWRQVTGMCA